MTLALVERIRERKAAKETRAAAEDTRIAGVDRDLSARERVVTQAYRDVLGRDPDPGGLREYSKYADYDTIASDLAFSDEARGRGVSSMDYGDVEVDSTKLDSNTRQFFEAYQQDAGYSGPLTQTLLRKLRNFSQAGDVNFMRANLRGQIQQFDGYSVVTPEALATMGGRYTGYGVDAGDAIVLPEGTKFGRKDEWEHVERRDGVDIYGATGNKTDGLLGAIGIDPDDLPDWVAPVTDVVTLNTGSGILGGRKLHDDSTKFYSDVFGRDFERYFNIAGQAVAAVGGAVAGGGPAGAAYGAAGMRALQGASQHSIDPNASLTDSMVSAALIAATPHMGLVGSAAASTAVQKARGDSWSESLREGGIQLATSMAVRLAPETMQSGASLALGAGRAALSDDPYAWDNVLGTAMQTAMGSLTSRGTPQNSTFSDRLQGVLQDVNPTRPEAWVSPRLYDRNAVVLEQEGEGNPVPRVRSRWAWQKGHGNRRLDGDQYPVLLSKAGDPYMHTYGVRGEPKGVPVYVDEDRNLVRHDGAHDRVGYVTKDEQIVMDAYQPWAQFEMQRRGLNRSTR